MRGLNEQALIEGAKSGDRGSQETLVRLYEGRLFGYIFRLVKNGEDARDVLQDTMIKALTNLGQYNPAYSFAGWLYRIATNKALDFLRRQKIEFRTFAYDEALVDTVPNGSVPADEAIASKLDWDIVEGCMDRLDAKYRTVLFLRYKDGLSYKEIGEALSIPMGTVKVLLHRGRLELKRLVRKEVGRP